MTYSIIARDAENGEMGIASQSQAFAVDSSVPALHAAEDAAGDFRGRRSAAVLVVRAYRTRLLPVPDLLTRVLP